MSDDLLNILDSEVAQLGEVVAWAQEQREKGRTSMESFRKAVVEKFAAVGFRAKVKCYETTEKDTYAFDFEILGRVENKPFDFDRMVHEVRSNVLGLPGDHSVIKTDPAVFRSPVKKKCGH